MMTTPYNGDIEEIKRLQTLISYNILDTPQEKEFDNLVKLISLICNSPIALISMIDDKRQWSKAQTGISQNEFPRAETLCQYTLKQDDILEIPDTRLDERAKNKPLVVAEGGIRFYAGVNLKASNGDNIGTLCVVDTQPKELTEDQKQALRLVADQTMILLETRKKNRDLSDELEEIMIKKINLTQKQLLQKETEYIFLLQAIKKSNGVVEFTPEGIIRSVNRNFLDITGHSKEEIIGQNHSIFLDEDQKGGSDKFWESLRQGNFYSGKLKRSHKDGSDVWIQATYNPISFQEDKVTRIIQIAQDITTEIEAKKSLEKSKELADRLNIQKDNFIANMSHEIRTPIHAILGFTELLLEQEQEKSKKSYLESVKTAGDNLLYIINDILDLSKIEAGIIHLDQEHFDLKQVIKNVFSILHLKAHQKKLSFSYHIAPDVDLSLVGDKNRLTQILINLLGNALKFTFSGSVELIVDTLEYENEINTLQFKVKDTGIGIPENKLDFIFDRFSQAEEDTSRKYGGTGLGLSISRQLIERQGGTIWAESEEGKGTVFNFYMPFGIGYIQMGQEEIVPLAATVKRWKSNILICEDNELNQKLIKAILTAKGFSIDLAENGRKGIDLFKENKYDLVLMDIQMPIMDGYEATRIIREELKSSVPIIALTANFLLSEKIKCRQLGMNDYLSKPFSKEDLLHKLDHILEQTEEKKQENMVEEPLSKDTLLMSTLEELSGGDKDFQREMMVLFMQQADQMVEELKQHAETKNIKGVKSTAHKFKTSFGIIGADIKLLNELEKIPESSDISISLRQNITALEEQLDEIYRILTELINVPYLNENPTC